MSSDYLSAGVDIEAGEETVKRITPIVQSTFQPGVLTDIGGFGGLFDLSKSSFKDPVLVAATDGVGTKAEIARLTKRFGTIGRDLVAMCVDDLVCIGATPLFFLDYVAVGNLNPEIVEQLVTGIAEGCREAKCALIGGEMAEHPGVMQNDQFDLVGFAVGAVERNSLLDGSASHPGDILIAIESPNLRSNGYSLARHVLLEKAGLSLDQPAWVGAKNSLADELLSPSVIYSPAVTDALNKHDIHAIAHITGGGLEKNLSRVLNNKVNAVIDTNTWTVPNIFQEIQKHGNISDYEMQQVFNMGVGMVLAVTHDNTDELIQTLDSHNKNAWVIGELVDGLGEVILQQ
ncbi:MAG TPA: phosphoribosylformylglycinamidine cyclo-ligase [Acidimicrobiales bacterium]|nr:phosphoribosylformylglycinamidine cyclo-ligase [Acidimicrobiales bacterium]